MHRDADLLRAWSGLPLPGHEDASDSLPEGPAACRWRTVFISDIHLGTPGCRADALLDFLRAAHGDRLFLLSDIVDGWQLRRRCDWPQAPKCGTSVAAYPVAGPLNVVGDKPRRRAGRALAARRLAHAASAARSCPGAGAGLRPGGGV